MGKPLIIESASELFEMAERDIMNVDSLISNPKYPVDLMYNIIFFHVTQAVEKFLKGFIVYNGKPVEKVHELDTLLKIAIEIDVSFNDIIDNCLLLNKLLPNIKYSSKKVITKQDMNETIKSFLAICNFMPIKILRDTFSKEHNYEIVKEIIAKPIR
ncbi:MAG: HEPN domain-containing protein [Treponema sp.]|nr:HEPN domain-containing protein [Treponema sp.]